MGSSPGTSRKACVDDDAVGGPDGFADLEDVAVLVAGGVDDVEDGGAGQQVQDGGLVSGEAGVREVATPKVIWPKVAEHLERVRRI